MATVKPEDASTVKREPTEDAALSPMEEDDYEDTGELQIPNEDQQAWLARLPKSLWEAWANLPDDVPDDEEIVLGSVRVYHQKPDDPPGQQQKLKILLNNISAHYEVPKQYNVTINKNSYNNAVVFSEKDQPGFKANAWSRDRRVQKERDNTQQTQHKVSKRPYRSSIPKQTALAGFLKHEVSLTAVENEEYHRLTKARYDRMFKPKHTTTILTGIDQSMHPGAGANDKFANFITGQKSTKGKKVQQEKAVRISQDELLDALTGCFKEYRYWSLKSLKQRLRQPEAFIKSSLEKIATLVRSGPFSGNYKLNDEYEASVRGDSGPVKEEAAVEDDTDVDIKDDDDDDGGFEDVNMDMDDG